MTPLQRLRRWAVRVLTLNDPALRNLFADARAHAGVAVSEHTALNLAAVWAAVRVISEDAATIPLFVYRRLDGGGKERAADRRLYRLLHDEPNPEMTSASFREALTAHALLWGNAYAEIERNGANEPVALWPFTPNRVTPERVRTTQQLIYRVKREDGTERVLFPNEILHVPGLSFDGIQGYSVIAKARESLGVSIAAERYAAEFFGKGGRPGVVLEHPQGLSQTAIERIRDDWRRLYGGPEHANEVAILEEGMKLHDFGVPQSDMQFLEQRKFGVTEVARWFRVPPHKIMDLERATFSNIEHQAIDYVVSTLRPWLVRWEQELNRKLIPGLERNRFFCEHLVDGLLRGDAAARSSALQTQFQNGALSPDEWREIENRNPLPDGQGKTYFVQGAMKTIEAAQRPPEEAVPPPPPPDEEEEDEEEDRGAAERAIGGGHVAQEHVVRVMLAEGIEKLVRQDVRAIGKARRRLVDDRDAVLAWADAYFATRARAVADTIRRPAALLGDVPPTAAPEIAERYVATALAELHAAAKLDELLERWGQGRADTFMETVGGTHAFR